MARNTALEPEDEKEPPKVLCVVCRNLMPEGARRCTKRHQYQALWRRRGDVSTTALALLSAIFSAVAATAVWANNILNDHSSTDVVFLTADGKVLTIAATNSGHKASVVREVALEFDKPVGIPKTPLDLMGSDNGILNAVPPEQTIALEYLARGGYKTTKGQSQIEAPLNATKVTLHATIEESDGDVHHIKKRYPGSWVASFVMEKVP
jgi:hypothetical protein